jgi:hypothetical protein
VQDGKVVRKGNARKEVETFIQNVHHLSTSCYSTRPSVHGTSSRLAHSCNGRRAGQTSISLNQSF